jgi:CBS-domain-containing membrane protein
MSYFSKMRGITKSPPRVSAKEIAISWLGCFLGIGVVAFINFVALEGTDTLFLVGSFGASATLLYGAIKSPLAQPRNFVGGHIVCALVGVTCFKFFHGSPWVASALAVAFAVAAMHATKTLHPPGGATALIAVLGGPAIHDLGFMYVLLPVGAGALAMLAVALLFNNLFSHRTYPEFWW